MQIGKDGLDAYQKALEEYRSLFDYMDQDSDHADQAASGYSYQSPDAPGVWFCDSDCPKQGPDWEKIPSKAPALHADEEWPAVIAYTATQAAERGERFGPAFNRLLAEYLSPISPDRKGSYEHYYRKYGERFSGYDMGGATVLTYSQGEWYYQMTPQEVERQEVFMGIYHAAYDRAYTAVHGGSQFSYLLSELDK